MQKLAKNDLQFLVKKQKFLFYIKYMTNYKFFTHNYINILDLEDISLKLSLFLLKNIDGKLQIIEFYYDNNIYNFYVVNLYGYYISIDGFFQSIKKNIREIIIEHFNDHLYEPNFILKDINIDTIITLNDIIIDYGNYILDELKHIGIIYDEIDNFKSDKTSRKKFINIYDSIRNLKLGDCQPNDCSFMFYVKISKYYNIKNFYSSMIPDLNYCKSPKMGSIINQEIFNKDKMFSEEFDNFLSSSSNIMIMQLFIDNYDNYNNIEHENLIIINKMRKEIERFDPGGDTIDPFLDQNLIRFFKRFFKDYTYISVLDYCPNGGIKNKIEVKFCYENDGFCLVLNQIYGFLRLLNPEYEKKEIIDTILLYNVFILRKFNTFVELFS